MRALIKIGGCIALSLSTSSAFSHHSIGGEFSNEQLTVVGSVVEFRLINPHAYIVLDVAHGDETRQWTLTFGPATKLIRGFDWTPSSVVAGERITATGRAARDGDGIYVVQLIKSDGQVLIDELQE